MAEVGNQYRQIFSARQRESFSAGLIVQEAFIEAVFSPAVNPIVGSVYKTIGAVGAMPGALAGPMTNFILRRDAVGGITNFIGKTKDFLDPGKLALRMELMAINEELSGDIKELTLKGTEVETSLDSSSDADSPEGVLGVVLNTMWEES